jgi:hypothetical protein
MPLASFLPFTPPQKHARHSVVRRTARSFPQKSTISRDKVFTTSPRDEFRPINIELTYHSNPKKAKNNFQ